MRAKCNNRNESNKTGHSRDTSKSRDACKSCESESEANYSRDTINIKNDNKNTIDFNSSMTTRIGSGKVCKGREASNSSRISQLKHQ